MAWQLVIRFFQTAGHVEVMFHVSSGLYSCPEETNGLNHWCAWRAKAGLFDLMPKSCKTSIAEKLNAGNKKFSEKENNNKNYKNPPNSALLFNTYPQSSQSTVHQQSPWQCTRESFFYSMWVSVSLWNMLMLLSGLLISCYPQFIHLLKWMVH